MGHPSLAKKTTASGFGLFSIRERMFSLGGRFDVHSMLGKGTTSTLILPLANAVPLSARRAYQGHQESRGGHKTELPTDSDTPKVRILVADDHPMVRRVICELLNHSQRFQVIGEAANGEEAVFLTSQLEPDVVLMDITMPKMDGVEATRQITDKYPGMIVMGLSVKNTIEVQRVMKAAGAMDCLPKEAATDYLVERILAARDRLSSTDETPN
jgi:CheY-like chemotaxis protein